MLSPERLSLPGPEYLGEEWGGAAGQRPEGPVPWVCCGPAWRGGSAGLGVAVARPGLPGDSGERPQARGVFSGRVGSGRAGLRGVRVIPCPPFGVGRGQHRGVSQVGVVGRCFSGCSPEAGGLRGPLGRRGLPFGALRCGLREGGGGLREVSCGLLPSRWRSFSP